MDPLTLGIVGGSMLLGGAASYFGARETNAANQAIAREQMAFQERMSNTAHQREVEDLRKAGLNPLLSTNGGSTTPGGASANMINAGDAFAKHIDPLQLIAYEKGRADIDFTEAQTAVQNTNAEIAKINKELLEMQKKWYEDHPQFAPGVESGIYSGKGIASAASTIKDVAKRGYSRLEEGLKGLNKDSDINKGLRAIFKNRS